SAGRSQSRDSMLVEMLDDRDADVRCAAIRARASVDGPGVDPPEVLARGLKDESAEVRMTAVSSLLSYSQGLDPWVPIVLRLADRAPVSTVPMRPLWGSTFRSFQPPAVTAAIVPDLTARLKSSQAWIRSQFAWHLREFKADAISAIPELLHVLNEPLDPHVA